MEPRNLNENVNLNMPLQKPGMYVGIDICGDYCMVSYYTEGMKEPETASFIPGEDVFKIPIALAKSYGMSRFYQGRKATELMRKKQADYIDNIYELAVAGQEVEIEGQTYSGMELFVIFLKRVLVSPDYIPKDAPIHKLIISVPDVTQQDVQLFSDVGARIGLPQGRLMLIDHRESFYYYALSREASLYRHEIVLFEHELGDKIYATRLVRDPASRPQMIRLQRDTYTFSADPSKKDRDFCRIIEKEFESHLVSSVFLKGSGFLGDWMEESLDTLCNNRRVFMGENLFSKGAVYGGLAKDRGRDWPFVYIGDYEMKMNLSLKVSYQNEMRFITLIDAGESWYETKGECEVILDGSAEFECWIQKPNSRKADVQVLELKEMPRRQNRTTRLRILAVPISDKQIKMQIKDMGFGEIEPSSGRTWEHVIVLEEEEEA